MLTGEEHIIVVVTSFLNKLIPEGYISIHLKNDLNLSLESRKEGFNNLFIQKRIYFQSNIVDAYFHCPLFKYFIVSFIYLCYFLWDVEITFDTN